MQVKTDSHLSFYSYWDMVQRHKITVFYTAPTAIRSLMRFGDDAPKKYDLSSLKVLGTVGEPINPAAWKWYYDVIGKGRCAVVDTYWQTETGGHVSKYLHYCSLVSINACICTYIQSNIMRYFLHRSNESFLQLPTCQESHR